LVAYFNFSPDLPTNRVELKLSFTVPAGMPYATVREKAQFVAVEKALRPLKLQGYELDTSGRGRLVGPLDPTPVGAGLTQGSYLHDPAKRERDSYYVVLPFYKKAALLEMPPEHEARVIRDEISRDVERELAQLEVV
jgi:hypothetical protein